MRHAALRKCVRAARNFRHLPDADTLARDLRSAYMPAKPTRAPPLDASKVAQMLAAAQRRPELPDFSWSDDPATFDGSSLTVRKPATAITPAARQLPLCESNPSTYDEKRRKIRDRYIGIRFAGVIRSAGDLQNAPRIIRAARAAFEQDHAETA